MADDERKFKFIEGLNKCSYRDNPNDVYDSRKFSTDDRKTLNDNLTKTFSSQVNKQTREIKSLEEKVSKNEATDGEKKKYQEMRTLKEVVKTRIPENVGTHISMISNDLNRIMKSTGGEYSTNLRQTFFRLNSRCIKTSRTHSIPQRRYRLIFRKTQK